MSMWGTPTIHNIQKMEAFFHTNEKHFWVEIKFSAPSEFNGDVWEDTTLYLHASDSVEKDKFEHLVLAINDIFGES